MDSCEVIEFSVSPDERTQFVMAKRERLWKRSQQPLNPEWLDYCLAKAVIDKPEWATNDMWNDYLWEISHNGELRKMLAKASREERKMVANPTILPA